MEYSVGEVVEVYSESKSRWLPGEIIELHDDGYLTVAYGIDLDNEKDLPIESDMIRYPNNKLKDSVDNSNLGSNDGSRDDKRESIRESDNKINKRNSKDDGKRNSIEYYRESMNIEVKNDDNKWEKGVITKIDRESIVIKTENGGTIIVDNVDDDVRPMSNVLDLKK